MRTILRRARDVREANNATRNSWFWLILGHPPKKAKIIQDLIIYVISFYVCQWLHVAINENETKSQNLTDFDWLCKRTHHGKWKIDGQDWLGTGQFDAARIIGARLRSSAQVILRLEIALKNASDIYLEDIWNYSSFLEIIICNHLHLFWIVLAWSTKTIDNTYTAIKPTAGTTNRQRKSIRKH